jgi:hypothetical protein
MDAMAQRVKSDWDDLYRTATVVHRWQVRSSASFTCCAAWFRQVCSVAACDPCCIHAGVA